MKEVEKFIKVESFMTKELQLSGYDLLIYAVVYGCTKAYGCYNGGYVFLMREYGFNKSTIYYSLERLKNANLIEVNKVGTVVEIVSNIEPHKVQRLNPSKVQKQNRRGSETEPNKVQGQNRRDSETEPNKDKKINIKASKANARVKETRPRAEPQLILFDESGIDTTDISLPFEF